MFALIEPESLLVQIPAQMRRVNTDVGSLEGPFQEAPEILDVVGMHVAANELDRMVNHFMRIDIGQAQVRFEGVGVEVRARLDGGANFWCQGSAANIGDMHGLDAAWSLFAAALDDPKHRFLARPASPLDLPLADVPVHVLGKATNERFVSFNL